MSMSKIASVAGILASASLVAGHGYVSGVVIDGQYHGGYLVDKYAYSDNPPDTIGWSTSATDLGFVDGSGYQSADIICHKSGKPGAISASVAAGSDIEIQWTEWPESHHGPVISYLANCGGDCSSVEPASLEFFKFDAKGLIDGSNVPGQWATDDLISNNNSWTVTIPKTLQEGNYVLRHEIIGLHSAGQKDGAQNYPQCLNLKVTGGGDAQPTGTKGEALYKDTDKGIQFDIYSDLSDGYPIPGPELWSA
ncbi:glycoside hydrolase [Aspergillus avenaceus]|uniref:Glycoside hydrolase n=1 Tax=Aspergillus avenaceus TaxID=36643 RepID=A0A5N6TN17_ASPAV|nr:glycoside hydrolase [Aspergillus avenaceus]